MHELLTRCYLEQSYYLYDAVLHQAADPELSDVQDCSILDAKGACVAHGFHNWMDAALITELLNHCIQGPDGQVSI